MLRSNVNLNIFFYFHKLNLDHFNNTNQDEEQKVKSGPLSDKIILSLLVTITKMKSNTEITLK